MHDMGDRRSSVSSSSRPSLSSPLQDTFLNNDENEQLDCNVKPSLRDRLQALFDGNIGLLLIAASQFFMASMGLTVKLLSNLDPPVPTFELIAARMGITCVCCVAYMLYRDIPYVFTGPPGIRGWLVFRSLTGFFGLFGLYYSLQYLSLSDAVSITFLAPTVTGVCGYFFLGESFTLKQGLAGLVSLLGVTLIARPESIFGPSGHTSIERGTSTQRLIAVGVALLGVFGATGAYISLRVIGTRAHPMHSVTYFSAWCLLVSVVGSVILKVEWVLPTDWKWMLGLVMIGFFGFGGQVLLAMGLQRETASRGALALYVQILYTVIFERIFFKGAPSALSVIGTCIILSSAVYVALTKTTTTKQPSPTTINTIGDVNLGVLKPPQSDGGAAYEALPSQDPQHEENQAGRSPV